MSGLHWTIPKGTSAPGKVLPPVSVSHKGIGRRPSDAGGADERIDQRCGVGHVVDRCAGLAGDRDQTHRGDRARQHRRHDCPRPGECQATSLGWCSDAPPHVAPPPRVRFLAEVLYCSAPAGHRQGAAGRVVRVERGVQRHALQTRGRLRDRGDPDLGRGDTGRYVIGRGGARFPAGAPPGRCRPSPATAGATVSWRAPTSSGGGGVDQYRVTSRPGGRHCTTTGPTTCTVHGLANGARYTFTVAAQVAADWSRPSPPSPAIVPGVPVDGHLLYPGADLAGADLSGADLQHVDIEGADLEGANLSGANLAHADLLGADLSGSTLTRAVLTGADLAYVNLYDASLDDATSRTPTSPVPP